MKNKKLQKMIEEVNEITTLIKEGEAKERDLLKLAKLNKDIRSEKIQ